MNFLDNKTILRELLKQGDLMNTVNGGIRETVFEIKNLGDDVLIEVSNPSVSPEAFNFTINKGDLLINVMHFDNSGTNGNQLMMYPLFFKIVKIPYYIDVNKIEASYEHGVFKVLLPYNNNLPKNPFRVRIKNLDN